MSKNIIKIFNKALEGNTESFLEINKCAVKAGYIVHPHCCTTEVLDFLKELPVNFNATFYKEWNDIISKNRFELYIKYKMDKYDAMYLVKSPKGHYGICLIVNTYHPLIQEAIYKIAEKTFYDTVVKSFMLIDSLKEITNL